MWANLQQSDLGLEELFLLDEPVLLERQLQLSALYLLRSSLGLALGSCRSKNIKIHINKKCTDITFNSYSFKKNQSRFFYLLISSFISRTLAWRRLISVCRPSAKLDMSSRSSLINKKQKPYSEKIHWQAHLQRHAGIEDVRPLEQQAAYLLPFV